MTGILHGLKVIDCGSFIAAPVAGTLLADHGADVIKVEPPDIGDSYRSLTRNPGMPKSEHNYGWLLDNRNKRGLALNLGAAEGREVLHRLIKDTDVFITNQPLAVRKKLGTDYETVSRLNDRLIYASFTGYGERGAESGKPGFDATAYWARSGLMDQVVSQAGATPSRAIAGMGDHPSGVALFSAIMLALYQREKTGKGAHVGSSLVANGIWANSVWAQAALCNATFFPRPPREQSFNALSCYYRCRDGGWILLTLLNEEKHFPILAQCLGRPELATDPLFADRPSRSKNATALIALLDEAFATGDSEDWKALFMKNGLIFEAVSRMHEVPKDQQLFDAEILVPFEGDTLLTINGPFFVTGAPTGNPRKPPGLGEHTDEILRSAGYDDASIAQMRAKKAVG